MRKWHQVPIGCALFPGENRLVVTFLTGFLLCFVNTQEESGGFEIFYRGRVQRVRDAEASPSKDFRLYIFVDAESHFLLEESGAGGWPWYLRFGRFTGDKGRSSPSLLFTYQQQNYPLELPETSLKNLERLQEGQTWSDHAGSWTVGGAKRIAGRETRRADVVARRGRRSTLWFAQDSGVLIAAEQTVFMGRGDEFRLTMELESLRDAEKTRGDALSSTFALLSELRGELGAVSGGHSPELSARQVRTAAGFVDRLTTAAEGTSIADFTAEMARDLRSQTKRNMDIAAAADRLLGKPLPAFQADRLTGGEFHSSTLDGAVSILHFWTYGR